jgi:hypothetical protein
MERLGGQLRSLRGASGVRIGASVRLPGSAERGVSAERGRTPRRGLRRRTRFARWRFGRRGDDARGRWRMTVASLCEEPRRAELKLPPASEDPLEKQAGGINKSTMPTWTGLVWAPASRQVSPD